jgi:hypothetical protein
MISKRQIDHIEAKGNEKKQDHGLLHNFIRRIYDDVMQSKSKRYKR